MNSWWLLLLLAIAALAVIVLMRRPRPLVRVPPVSAYASLFSGAESLVAPRSLGDGGIGIRFPVTGPIESGDWVFVRGVRFSERELKSEWARHQLSTDVREFLEQAAPHLTSLLGSNSTQNGYVNEPDGSKTFQFITAKLSWTTERSFAPNSSCSGSSFRITRANIECYASEARLFAMSRGPIQIDLKLEYFCPNTPRITEMASGYKERIGPILDFNPKYADGKLLPAFASDVQLAASWMPNDVSSEANLTVELHERVGGEHE